MCRALFSGYLSQVVKAQSGRTAMQWLETFTIWQAGHLLRNSPGMSIKEVAYALPEGGVSAPTRTSVGFHIIKVNARRPNPGLARVAHVLVACPADSSGTYREAMRAKADSLYQALKGGADFAEVAKRYSDDPQSARVGGDLPAFGPGEMVAPFEEASFALREPGAVGLATELVRYAIKEGIAQL